MKSPRFWTIVLLFCLTLVILQRRGDTDRAPFSTPLNQFPDSVAQWNGVDNPIDPGVLEVMGKGIFLNRLYTPASSSDPTATGPIALFIGFFPTQRTGQSIHSPQNCLPGSGWAFESSGLTEIAGADGKTHQVGDYIISNGTSRDEVFYWYQSHGRTIANDYKAKLYMIADSIRYNRSDAALVRVVTPIQAGETSQQAHRRAAAFTGNLFPILPAYIPN